MTTADSRRWFGPLAAFLFCSVAACVLVVPTPRDDLSGTCQLTADERDTTCGACLETSCQAELDACCGAGEACEPVIAELVECDTYLHECPARGESRSERELRRCVATLCESQCNLDPADVEGLVDGGTDAAAAAKVCDSAERCECKVVQNATARGTCAPGTRGEWLCCASPTYPAVGTGCVCAPVECRQSGSTCRCEAYAEHSLTQETTSTCSLEEEGTCCLGDFTCDCVEWRSECPAGSAPVSSCTVDDLRCRDSVAIPSCTD